MIKISLRLFIKEEISKSEEFTNKQIDLINSMVENQKLYFEEIAIMGNDGLERKLPPMIFTLTKD